MIWTRARIEERCGNCRATIAVGDPLAKLTTFGKIRCVACAGPAPEDVPPLPERPPDPPPQPVRRLAGLPLDWKTRSANDEREPGQEG